MTTEFEITLQACRQANITDGSPFFHDFPIDRMGIERLGDCIEFISWASQVDQAVKTLLVALLLFLLLTTADIVPKPWTRRTRRWTPNS